MYGRQVLGIFWSVILLSVLLQACGEPSVCQNDQQCTGDRICLYGKCVDASEKPKEATPAEPKPETVAEVTPETTPEAGPEELPKETSPEIVTDVDPPGIRKEGQTCDPHRTDGQVAHDPRRKPF